MDSGTGHEVRSRTKGNVGGRLGRGASRVPRDAEVIETGNIHDEENRPSEERKRGGVMTNSPIGGEQEGPNRIHKE